MTEKIIPEKLNTSQSIITALETEDEIGTVLRLHLTIEKALLFYLERKLTGELATYIPMPRNFSGKLSLSIAFGLPIPLASIAHHINKIRNKLAHGHKDCLNSGDIKELAKKVNRLSEIDSSFRPIEKKYVELYRTRPGERIFFGSDSLRIDFLIIGMALNFYLLKWLSIFFKEE